MARAPRQWYWKARAGWYATVGGARHRLASSEEGEAAAQIRLGEMLAARRRPESRTPTVAEVLDEYMDHLGKRVRDGTLTAKTLEVSAFLIAPFAKEAGGLAADELRPGHVEAWLDGRTTWGPTTRSDAVAAIRAAFRHAVRRRMLESDPTSAICRPRRGDRRGSIASAADLAAIRAHILSPAFRDYFDFLWLTGCRPGEAARIEARHVDFGAGVVVLPEHKTRHRTGKARRIYCPASALEILVGLARRHPDGILFRTARGTSWGRQAAKDHLRRVAARAGVGKGAFPYALRHRFASDALARGVSPALVAKLLGHSGLHTLGKYEHLDEYTAALRDAASAIRGDPQDDG